MEEQPDGPPPPTQASQAPRPCKLTPPGARLVPIESAKSAGASTGFLSKKSSKKDPTRAYKSAHARRGVSYTPEDGLKCSRPPTASSAHTKSYAQQIESAPAAPARARRAAADAAATRVGPSPNRRDAVLTPTIHFTNFAFSAAAPRRAARCENVVEGRLRAYPSSQARSLPP